MQIKFGHLVTIAGVLALRQWLSKRTITWKEVESWILQHGNPEFSGVGFVGDSLRPGSRNSYVEVRREQSDGKVKVTASLLFNARQGAFANQTWAGNGLDKALEKRFGDDFRFRMKL